MSQENVELLHRAYDAFNRRDLDALLALCDPDVEFISYTMQVERGDPYRGHDGVRSWSGGSSPSTRTSAQRSRRYETFGT
jgi:ketosteroid isomerase-like protein